MAMSLESDAEFYKKKKSELLQHNKGQFALIKDGVVHGTFSTEKEAYEAGVKLFGNAEMLIQQILEEETVTFVPALFVGFHSANL